MTTIADRLQEALALRGLKIRAFHRLMHEKKVLGNSYPAIHRYLRGEQTPSVDFLLAAADLLEVRPAWLAFGELPQLANDGESMTTLRGKLQAEYDALRVRIGVLQAQADALLATGLVKP